MRCFDGWMFRLVRAVGPGGRKLLRMHGYRSITLPARHGTRANRDGRHHTLPEVHMVAHPATSKKLVIIYPGLNATVDGESLSFSQAHPFRYRHLAERLQAEGAASVLRVANPASGYYVGGQVAVDRLRRAIDYALAHARSLCGDRSPTLCLMGFSAGAGAAAALASDYQPQRMLLIAPSGDVGPERVVASLKAYTGQLVLMVGEKDEVVGRDSACLFDELSPATSDKQVHFIPECDHFFTREEHNHLLEEQCMNTFT